MAERKNLGKKLRFEVFKRDSFTCQYCGRKAPEIILEVDHINPVKEGGTNELMNLITSCIDCNRGKGARKISDSSILKKQINQIEELNIKRQQLEMMIEWKNGLKDLDNDIYNAAFNYWSDIFDSCPLNENGKHKIKILIKKVGLSMVIDEMKNCSETYYDTFKTEHENSEFIFNKLVSRIYYLDLPIYKQKISYIKGILRNKMRYLNEKKFYSIISDINNKESTDLLSFIIEELKVVDLLNSYNLEEVIAGIIQRYKSKNNGKQI